MKHLFRNLFSKAIQFGLVGILGTVTNLLMFFIIGDILGLNENLSAILSFSLAVTQNYLLNSFWTYRDTIPRASFRKYTHFVAVSLIGLAVNLAVLNSVLYLFPDLKWKTIAQAAGIGTAFILNFVFSHFIVFRKRQ